MAADDVATEERALVAACLQGDQEALRRFVDRFEGLVFGLCLRILRDRQEAEDIAQEVFVRAIRALSRWDSERPLRPWLARIATNRCRTQLARLRRRPTTSEFSTDVVDHRQTAPEPQHAARELLGEIHELLSELRPEQRQAFLLFHEQGLGYEEMSQVTGTPVGTLKTWLHRTRKKLLDRLQAKGLGPPEPEVGHDLFVARRRPG